MSLRSESPRVVGRGSRETFPSDRACVLIFPPRAVLAKSGLSQPIVVRRDDETTWSARTWMAFVTQRLSVAAQLSMAQEVAEALGLSVAADPRAQ